MKIKILIVIILVLFLVLGLSGNENSNLEKVAKDGYEKGGKEGALRFMHNFKNNSFEIMLSMYFYIIMTLKQY